jgi:hypothetical protein
MQRNLVQFELYKIFGTKASKTKVERRANGGASPRDWVE